MTEAFEAGLESLRCHRVYLAGLGPDSPDPREFLEGFARAVGVRFGVAFEVFPLQLL